MKRSTSIFVFGVGVSISALVAAPKQTITKQMVLEAITQFRIDPTSSNAMDAASVVVRFVDQSPDVVVTLTAKPLSFFGSKSASERENSLLLYAFIVGDVDSQLLRDRKKDDFYAGVREVIGAYLQLQKKNPKLRIAEVERFIELEKHGQLKTYVETK